MEYDGPMAYSDLHTKLMQMYKIIIVAHALQSLVGPQKCYQKISLGRLQNDAARTLTDYFDMYGVYLYIIDLQYRHTTIPYNVKIASLFESATLAPIIHIFNKY